MIFRKCRHILEFVVFRTLLCAIGIMPLWMIDRLAAVLAFLVHRVLPRRWTRYAVARENLRQALGESVDHHRLVGRMWRHLFCTVGEVIYFQGRLTRASYRHWMRFRNRGDVVRSLCSDRPVILISGHLGNWELAVWVFGLFGFPMGVVARRLDNPWLDHFFQRFRRDTGHELLAKQGASSAMIDRLESGGHLALLGDQDAGSRGLFVDFFGRPASTFKSIALLALRHRAIICVGYAIRLEKNDGPERFEIGCEEVIDSEMLNGPDPVGDLTRRYTAALERVVRRCPDQYFWVHRRWKSEPGRRRQRRAAA